MALVKCPECGKEISNLAKSCPNCGCPIESISPSGEVRIKLSPVKAATGFNGQQKATIFCGSKVLWEGYTGEVAELFFDKATNVTVKYHLSLMHYGGECSGIVDPVKSKKYNVSSRQGIMSTKLVLQPVDIFDAD